VSFARGAVVVVDLDPTAGHEQRAVRPCIVVSDPMIVNDQRFPLLGVVPVTGTTVEGLLYPGIVPSPLSGLAKRSFALVD
jgi:mRNA interferase MazF